MLRGGQVKTKQSGPVGAVQASGVPCQMPCVFIYSELALAKSDLICPINSGFLCLHIQYHQQQKKQDIRVCIS